MPYPVPGGGTQSPMFPGFQREVHRLGDLIPPGQLYCFYNLLVAAVNTLWRLLLVRLSHRVLDILDQAAIDGLNNPVFTGGGHIAMKLHIIRHQLHMGTLGLVF